MTLANEFLCCWCWLYRPASMLAKRIGPRKRPQCRTCADRILNRIVEATSRPQRFTQEIVVDRSRTK